ncbi:hypothetical protein ACFX13_006514 [Malus domestica]
MSSGDGDSMEVEYIWRHHRHGPRKNQGTSALVRHIKAHMHLGMKKPNLYCPELFTCPTSEAGDLVFAIFRKFLHKRSSAGNFQKQEIWSLPMGANLMEKLKVVVVGLDRIQLDGLAPPEPESKSSPMEKSGLTMKETKKLLRVAQLEAVARICHGSTNYQTRNLGLGFCALKVQVLAATMARCRSRSRSYSPRRRSRTPSCGRKQHSAILSLPVTLTLTGKYDLTITDPFLKGTAGLMVRDKCLWRGLGTYLQRQQKRDELRGAALARGQLLLLVALKAAF